MSQPTTPQIRLKQTPLNAAHRALGARMVDFGGWDMPVQYSGVIDEHRAVREALGLFDVSHMGEFEVQGAGALALINRLTPNDASKLKPGRIQYSALTTPEGTFHDDILVYCRAEDDYFVVVNASNIAKDFAWIQQHVEGATKLRNVSDDTALLALQGPRAAELLAALAPGLAVDTLGYYHFVADARVADLPVGLVSRTGYTGEDGFELYLEADRAEALWARLLDAGQKLGIKACGLGARDTLRLEAKLPLYGNDIDATTSVVEADLGWIIKASKPAFMGRDVLVAQKSAGAKRRLIGFEMMDRGIARHGYPVRVAGAPSGQVTSGTHSPTLEKAIGLAYVPTESASPGTEIEIEIRGKAARARIVATPFVPHRTRR